MADTLKKTEKAIVGYDTKEGICLIVKQGNKKCKKYIEGVRWYFYIKLEDYGKANETLNFFEEKGLIIATIRGKKYVRIQAHRQTRDNPTIDMLRAELEDQGIQVYEFDLSKTKRYMIDNKVEVETNMNILYFDIETDDSTGEIMVGRDRIFSWAGCDKDDNIYFECGKEEDILRKFVKVLDNYDIITGWNSGQFDLPYLQMRCERYGIHYNWKNIIHIDMMQRCFKIYGYEAGNIGLKSFSLNEISKAFLGKEKTDHTGYKIHQLFESHRDLLKEYNINDTLLLKELDTKLNILSLMIQECSWTGSFLNKFYIGELLDNYILKEARKENIILGSRPSDRTKAEREDIDIVGGYVMEPKTGIYEDVTVLDFKGLYPSIIVGWNIGLDSLDINLTQQGWEGMVKVLEGRKIEDLPYSEWNSFLINEKQRLDPNNDYFQAANNSYFRRDTKSFIGSLVEKLLAQRAEYKKKLKVLAFDTPEYNNTYAAERVVKEMANSMFGITCDKNSRYFDKYVSEAITFTGQFLNKTSAHIVTELGFKAIYGDTDSLFVVGCPDMDIGIESINSALRAILDIQFELVNNIVRLDYEKKFKKFILLEKKRYTGLLCMKDGKAVNKVFSRGTEDVRKSNIKFTKKCFKELSDKLYAGMTQWQAVEYVRYLRKKVQTEKIEIDDLLITTRVSKKIDSYKTLTIGARLAKRLIAQHKISDIVESKKQMGTRLEYIIVDRKGKIEGVLLEEFDGVWNRDYYWEIQVYAPLKRILRCIFPGVNWNEYDEFDYQASLFS